MFAAPDAAVSGALAIHIDRGVEVRSVDLDAFSADLAIPLFKLVERVLEIRGNKFVRFIEEVILFAVRECAF